MNAYILKRIKFDGRVHRATVRAPTDFVKGSFKTFSISKEIKIIVGKELSREEDQKCVLLAFGDFYERFNLSLYFAPT